MTRDLIRDIEELSLNAWPSLQTTYYDGWILRFANGYTRRANSINPLYPSTVALAEKVACCEELYAARHLATIFKICPSVMPPDLDTRLEAAGYAQNALTSVQTVSLTDANLSTLHTGFQSQLLWHLTDGWVDDFCRLSKVEAKHRATMTLMLRAISGLSCYAMLKEGTNTVAVGLAVVERKHVGLFDIVTAETYRRRGYARQLILDLLLWAKQQEATTAYLQVMFNNTPALRLYEGIGFREIYQYWYRVKDQ